VSTVYYERVTAGRRLRGICPVCGRVSSRSRTFEMTVNPFNRNLDGIVKTRAEVRADVDAEAAAWIPDFTHGPCRGGAA
jgi:hypothetical protein